MRALHRLMIGAAFLSSAVWAGMTGYAIASNNAQGALTGAVVFVAVLAPAFWGAIDYTFKRHDRGTRPF